MGYNLPGRDLLGGIGSGSAGMGSTAALADDAAAEIVVDDDEVAAKCILKDDAVVWRIVQQLQREHNLAAAKLGEESAVFSRVVDLP